MEEVQGSSPCSSTRTRLLQSLAGYTPDGLEEGVWCERCLGYGAPFLLSGSGARDRPLTTVRPVGIGELLKGIEVKIGSAIDMYNQPSDVQRLFDSRVGFQTQQ